MTHDDTLSDAPLRFMVVAQEKQQRLAFSDTIRDWGFDLVDCLPVEQLCEKHFQEAVDIWLIDTEQDYEIVQNLDIHLMTHRPRAILVGFTPAPYVNESQLYGKWQRQLKRKLAQMLSRPDLLQQPNVSFANVTPWRYVVMLGASMGGPYAIKEFLDNLPADLPVALLLAQHFNQHMLNALPRILTRHNDWRCDVVMHTQQLLAGRCLIVPTEQALVCDSNGRVIMQKQGWQGMYQPSISQLLKNCSEAFGNSLVAIIFSGMGDDGSHSAKLAKLNGTTIWAQTPQSSACASQPQSMIDTGVVDYIATPKELALAVVNLCKTRRLPNGLAHG